jgi:hypothetical protein
MICNDQTWPNNRVYRRNRGAEADQNADHLKPQFLIVIQKYYFEKISRRESVIIGTDSLIVEENGITQKPIVKLR